MMKSVSIPKHNSNGSYQTGLMGFPYPPGWVQAFTHRSNLDYLSTDPHRCWRYYRYCMGTEAAGVGRGRWCNVWADDTGNTYRHTLSRLPIRTPHPSWMQTLRPLFTEGDLICMFSKKLQTMTIKAGPLYYIWFVFLQQSRSKTLKSNVYILP